MHGLAKILLLHFLAVTFAPGWIVGDFMLERGRIERELCVQRMVPDDLRSCHGECQLSKRLESCEQRAENLPNELKAVRIGEMLSDGGIVVLQMPMDGRGLQWPVLEEEVLGGHLRVLAPVPLC